VPDEELPSVAVIVPAHNEAALIDRCLTSLKAQDYPHDRMEIVVVDDGSTDETAEIAEAHVHGGDGRDLVIRGEKIAVGPFAGRFLVIRNGHAGKAHALNTGIDACDAEIVVNVDSDVVLAPGSVRAIAEAFVRDPRLGAATGNVEIDWEMLEARDESGGIVLAEDGLPVPRRLSAGERFLARSQFLEYVSSFRLGRHAQSITDSMYTLAGACSAFRRSSLEAARGYSNRTVSEDTDITWMLHRAGVRIGFVPKARVLLEPVTTWDALYAQRVRWARGQLEVTALNMESRDAHMDERGRMRRDFARRRTLAKMLLFDHTLAFPRLVWAPLILFFPLLGYSPRLIAVALLAMYALYLAIEVVDALACFSVAEEDTRERIEHCGWTLLGLPAYRFVVFHFRFSGFLVTLTEEQQWTVPGGFGRTRERLEVAKLRSVQAATLLVRVATQLWNLAGVVLAAVIAPMLVGIVVGLTRIVETLVRRNA
jgi:cellulose synthase/poly-beta-1,6-N-acetylglucosamine synthase-like glycosyltransferase